MSLNKQFVLGKSATEEQCIDWMPSFIHTFYNVTSSVLQENSATQLKWIEPIFRHFNQYFEKFWNVTILHETPKNGQLRSRGSRCKERKLGTRLIVFHVTSLQPSWFGCVLHDVTAAILRSQNKQTAAMLVYQRLARRERYGFVHKNIITLLNY